MVTQVYVGGCDMSIKPVSGKIKSQEINDNLSYLDSIKRSKNEEIRMSDLDQEVREGMTGGAVPVVGKDAVREENIANRSVISEKRTEIGDYGLILSRGGTPNFDFENGVLTIPGKVELVHRNQAFTLDHVEIMLETRYSSGIVLYDTINLQFVVRNFGGAPQLNDSAQSEILIAVFDKSERKAFMAGSYTIDGKLPFMDGTVTGDLIIPLSSKAYLIAGSGANHPDIDTVNRTITFYGTFFIYYNKKRYDFTENLTLDFIDVYTLQYLFFNPITEAFMFVRSGSYNEDKFNDSEILLGYFSFWINTSSDFRVKDASVNFKYTIDGKDPNAGDITDDKPYMFPPELLIGDYDPIDTKAADGSDSTSEFDYHTTMSADVHDKLDDLVSNHSDYITKTLLGYDESGDLPIYFYDYCPEEREARPDHYKELPKLVLFSGVHGSGPGGDNPTSVFSLYYFLNNVCNNWQDNEALEWVRHNIRLLVVPIANPWGFDNRSRYNSNDVDINRNWDIGWTSNTHHGTEPFSEKETKYLRDIILENKDALYCADIHTTGGEDEKRTDSTIIWHALNEYSETYYIAKHHASKTSRMWRGKFGLSTTPWNVLITRGLASSNSILKNWVEGVANMPASTFEMAPQIESQSRNNGNIIYMMTQALGNWVLQVIRFYQNK